MIATSCYPRVVNGAPQSKPAGEIDDPVPAFFCKQAEKPVEPGKHHHHAKEEEETNLDIGFTVIDRAEPVGNPDSVEEAQRSKRDSRVFEPGEAAQDCSDQNQRMQQSIKQNVAYHVEEFFLQPFEADDNVIVARHETLFPDELAPGDERGSD